MKYIVPYVFVNTITLLLYANELYVLYKEICMHISLSVMGTVEYFIMPYNKI